MIKQSKCDVVVVGGGFAGLTAAVRSAEVGLKVVLLEKGAGAYPCNSRYSGGIFHIAFEDPMSSPARLREVMLAARQGEVDPALSETLTNNAGRAIAWMKERGATFIKVGKYDCVLAAPAPGQKTDVPQYSPASGLVWQGRGPDVMLAKLCRRLSELGGTLQLETRAEDLLTDGKKCTGVRARSRSAPLEIEAHAVVLADGGFQANPEFLKSNIAPRPQAVKQRGAATGTGDALAMALAVGADTTALQGFYGHVLSRDAMHNDRLWPYPELDLLAAAGIVVDREGRRQLDEGGRGVYIANKIAALPDPLSSTIVFDSAIWNGPGRDARIPPNPQLELAGGTIHSAATISALATAAGLSAQGLQATVDAYNSACESKATHLLFPPRTTGFCAAWPIKTPPFFAVPVCAGITYTMGGIRINADARVLDKKGQPIEGLYAAGCSTGGVDGGPLCKYIGGLARAAILGMQAADDIARRLAR